MSQYFHETYEHSDGNVKVELSVSNYTTKANMKRATSIDTSTLASKTELTGLKTKVDNLDVYKLMSISVDLSKLSNDVNQDVMKKTMYVKVNAIDTEVKSTSWLVTKN